ARAPRGRAAGLLGHAAGGEPRPRVPVQRGDADAGSARGWPMEGVRGWLQRLRLTGEKPTPRSQGELAAPLVRGAKRKAEDGAELQGDARAGSAAGTDRGAGDRAEAAARAHACRRL